MLYPSKLGSFSIVGDTTKEFQSILEACKRFGQHFKFEVRGRRYPHKWVVYCNTTQWQKLTKLQAWIKERFDVTPTLSRLEHRKLINQRVARENLELSLRAKLWSFPYQQVLDAAIQHLSLDGLDVLARRKGFKTLNHGKLISLLADDTADMEAVLNLLMASATDEQVRVVEAVVVYDDPWAESLVESYDSTEDTDIEFGDTLTEFMEQYFSQLTQHLLPAPGVMDELRALSRNKLRARAKELGIARYSVLSREELARAIAPVIYELGQAIS